MEWSEADEKVFNDVQQYGWHVMIVADDPWFAYTIGLYARFQQPEIVVFGLRKEDLHAACNAYGQQVKDGERPTPDAYLTTKSVLSPVDPSHLDDYFGIGRWFYQGKDFPVLQLIWSDAEGRFPMDLECSTAVARAQPFLGPPAPDLP